MASLRAYEVDTPIVTGDHPADNASGPAHLRPTAPKYPGLARSLGAHGAVLLGLGRPAEAAAAFAEGLQALLPLARRLPRAYGRLLAALLNDYLRAARAASQAPNADLVRRALVVGVQGPAPLPEEIFAWVEEAACGEAPLKSDIARILQAIQETEDAPAALHTLAARLLAVLQGERDPEKLTQGLTDATLRQHVQAVLTRLPC